LGFLDRLSQHLLYLGIPGLFAIALLDSAAVPLAGGADGLIILLAWQRPDSFILIGLVAAMGSTLGCLILYRVAHAGRKLALARISPKRLAWVQQKIANHGFLAIFVSVLIPPPFPTKPVIAAAGAFGTPWPSFTAAVLFGRLIRYLGLAYLGSRFGNQAALIIRSQYPMILLILAAIALVVFVARRVRRT
jgi:membrane protein DedA with SNARE-associated domain